MVLKSFKINKRVFKKRKLSTLQHKLRVIMKCYTIVGFDLDDETQTFTFKKTHKINGLKMDDPKEHTGRFELEDLDDDNINLILIVGESKKEDEDAD
jgi:hypothetical protein